MDLSTDKIANKMLTGTELKECAVAEFRAMLERDYMFTNKVAFKRVAFTLGATFHFSYPSPADYKLYSRTKKEGALEGEVPLANVDPDDSEVVALERDVNLDNPNLARVQHDLPIIVQERRPPQSSAQESMIPGEPPAALTNLFPQVVTHELKYDKTQYPKGPEPVDRDVSDVKAAELGVKRHKKG